MDVHKVQTQIAWCSSEGEIREQRIVTTRERLTHVFGGRPRARILFEASTESEWVAQTLEGLGHEVIVADPNFAPMYGMRERRVKTDRRDARALLEACRSGTYRPAHRLSEAQRTARVVLAARALQVRARSRLITSLRTVVRGHGLRVRSCEAEAFARHLATLPLPAALATAIAPMQRTLTQLDTEIALADVDLAVRAAADPIAQRLRTVPTIGPVTALTFVSVVDDVARFPSSHHLMSYVGLVPQEWSSGEQQRRGHITKRGNRWLRALLVQAAWGVWRSRRADLAGLRTWMQALAARRGRRIAVVAVARRLAGILYAVWRDGAVFDPTKCGTLTPAPAAR